MVSPKRPDFFRNVVARYLAEADSAVTTLGDPSLSSEVLTAAAHTLKGSSRQIGALPLGDLCEQVESALREAQRDGAADLIRRTHAEFERVRAALQQQVA
jgi:HPt (histidine-containing phosphotransfer) domain-containing protein